MQFKTIGHSTDRALLLAMQTCGVNCRKNPAWRNMQKPIYKRPFFMVSLMGTLVFWGYFWFCLPANLFTKPTATVIEDARGNLLGAHIASDGQWRFPAQDSVPEKFAAALIAFEDRKFHKHGGVYVPSLFRAFRQNFKEGRIVSGGSTLSMQVIRMADERTGRSYLSKASEVVKAWRLEFRFSKDEILALYAANAPFGGNVVGLEAASWRYFGRSPEALTWAEAATLAVLPNAPSLIHPGKNRERLLQKRNRLLRYLHVEGHFDEVSLSLALDEALPDKPNPLPNVAPHLLTRAINDGHRGKRIKSTLSKNLQEGAQDILQTHYRFLKHNHIHNAAILILDARTSAVLAYCGNIINEEKAHQSDVDIIMAPRSTGSIIKPFLYAAALEDGLILPRTLLPDIPTQYDSYTPKNFSTGYDGAVSADEVLARSLNIPMLRLLKDFGVPKFHHTLNQKLGFTTVRRSATHYGLSLILGGAEVNLWELCGAYAGLQQPLFSESEIWQPHYHHFQKLENRPAPFDVATAYLTLAAMQKVVRPESEAGWEKFTTSRPLAWKTGTSFGFRDAWAVGVSPDYVIGVWVGNASGEGRPSLTGILRAGPVLFDVLKILPRQSPWHVAPFLEMKSVKTCAQSGHRALPHCPDVREEWVHKKGLNSAPCKYHKLVSLDRIEDIRVSANCRPTDEIRTVAWFELPPMMGWFYRKKNPAYRPLPDFAPGCNPSPQGRNMAFIYPAASSKVYIPKMADGEPGQLVFEIAHKKPQIQVFWHIDNKYLGATTEIHQMGVFLTSGRYTLTVVDEEGSEISRSIEVLEGG